MVSWFLNSMVLHKIIVFHMDVWTLNIISWPIPNKGTSPLSTKHTKDNATSLPQWDSRNHTTPVLPSLFPMTQVWYTRMSFTQAQKLLDAQWIILAVSWTQLWKIKIIIIITMIEVQLNSLLTQSIDYPEPNAKFLFLSLLFTTASLPLSLNLTAAARNPKGGCCFVK